MLCVVSSRNTTYPSPKTIPPKSGTSFKAILHPVSVITGHLHRTSLIIGDLPCTILATISNVFVSYFITYLSYFIPKQTHILVYIYRYCISVQRHIQIIHTQFSAILLCYCSLVSVITPIHLFHLLLEALFMIHKCCSKAPCLISDFRRIHIIEDRQNYPVSIPLTLHDHYKFIQAPPR